MITPEVIYLIAGEDIEGYPGMVWCESSAPSDHCDPEKAVKYVRADIHESTTTELQEEIGHLEDSFIKQGQMLRDIVTITKGPPVDKIHSTHDAVESVERLQARVVELEGTINAVGEAFGAGSAARTRGTLVTCTENTVKFTKCLDAVERFFMVPGQPYEEDEEGQYHDDDHPHWEVEDECLLNHWANSPEEYAEQFRVELLRKQAEAVDRFFNSMIMECDQSEECDSFGHRKSYAEHYIKSLRNDATKAEGADNAK